MHRAYPEAGESPLFKKKKTIGRHNVILEADCMEVIDVMLNGGNLLGQAVAIYEECSFLSRNFSSITFNHCPREANMATGVLASKAQCDRSIVWQSEPPGFLLMFWQTMHPYLSLKYKTPCWCIALKKYHQFTCVVYIMIKC